MTIMCFSETEDYSINGNPVAGITVSQHGNVVSLPPEIIEDIIQKLNNYTTIPV